MPYFGRMKVTVTSKGQITLPAVLRKRHGWKQGTVLEFSDSENRVVVRTSVSRRSPRSVIGCLRGVDAAAQDVATYLDETRGPVELPREKSQP